VVITILTPENNHYPGTKEGPFTPSIVQQKCHLFNIESIIICYVVCLF